MHTQDLSMPMCHTSAANAGKRRASWVLGRGPVHADGTVPIVDRIFEP